jgi:hypothetical protein
MVDQRSCALPDVPAESGFGTGSCQRQACRVRSWPPTRGPLGYAVKPGRQSLRRLKFHLAATAGF